MLTLNLNKKNWAFRAGFFIGCPLLIALPLGLFQAGFGRFLPADLSLLFWVVSWTSMWWLSELCLRGLHALFRPWNVPVVAEIILAYICATIASAFYLPMIMQFFAQSSFSLLTYNPWPAADRGSTAHMLAVARSGLSGLVAWSILRSLYAMLPGEDSSLLPMRAGSNMETRAVLERKVTAAVSEPPMTRFHRELAANGVRQLSEIAVMQASDHYVNVHLYSGRKIFLLARFSDALETMTGEDGLRIHRSFWVGRAAIGHVVRDGNSLAVHLANGLDCPVSTKYLGHFEHFMATA